MADELSRFRESIAPFRDTWRKIDIRFVATRTESDNWQVEAGRATLDFSGGGSLVRGLPVLDRLIAVHERWEISRLEELMRAFSEGYLRLGGHEILLQRGGRAGSSLGPLSLYSRRYPREEAEARFNLGGTTVVLAAWEHWSESADSRHNRLLTDGELRLADVPWEGVRDLKGGFVGLSADDAVRENVQQIDVCAPLGLRFGSEASIASNEVSCEVQRARGFDPRESLLSTFIWQHARVVERHRLRLDSPGFKKQTRKVAVAGTRHAPAGVTLVLGRGKWETDRLHITSSGAGRDDVRRAAFDAQGGSYEALVESLSAKSGQPLEEAVSVLFHLLGFYTVRYGGNLFPAKRGAADIIAFPPRGKWLIVIEATSHAADSVADIAKLSTRAKVLQATAVGHTVHAVWITQQGRSELPERTGPSAADERVSIITRDDFESFVLQAFEDLSPESVLKEILSRVPTRPAQF